MNNFVWMAAKKAYFGSEMNALIRIHLLLIYKYSFFTRNPEIFHTKKVKVQPCYALRGEIFADCRGNLRTLQGGEMWGALHTYQPPL